MKRLAVLVSGTGTNLESIIAARLPVELVLADRICPAVEIAVASNIPSIVIDRRDYGFSPGVDWDRDSFTEAVHAELVNHRIDLIAMAGFMTVLGPTIFEQFENRILNTHPSLLPSFKGARAVPRALADGVAETGITVHIATPILDSGRVLAQARVPIEPGDTEYTLHQRIKAVERQLYPEAIRNYQI